ncbi:hypothetical protein [Cellulomonas cellasea]|uniref:Uncharacterized protein n=1 Tax=Cellulomonas cellasea TaxID=43670 RepID=A0A4Y3KUF3_9CELL|nr:hypothetical protein [Cellulomonas cellasea]GEA88059.1 hypothetical protein CCE01nite_20080 [Cellulomonas cellasea]
MQSTLVLAAFTTVCALALLAHSLVRRFVRDAVRRTALQVDLPLDEATERLVVGRFRRRERWAGTGALLGGLLPLAFLLPGDDGAALLGATGGDLRGFAVLLGFFAGTAAGLGLLAWRETIRPVDEPGPRVARASVPVVEDYVTPHERRGAWVLAGAGVAVTAWAGLREGPGLPGALVALGIAVPVAAVVVTEVLLRRLVAARQAATTPLALAWDDVLRARTARDLVTVPLTAGAYLPLVITSRAEAVGSLPDGVSLVLVLAMLVTAGVSALLDPRGHVRRRLWPQPPAPSVAPPSVTPPSGPASPAAGPSVPGPRPGAAGAL